MKIKSINNICTKCGSKDTVSVPLYEHWHGIKLKIALCRFCVPLLVKAYLDGLLENGTKDVTVDKLTKFGQG